MAYLPIPIPLPSSVVTAVNVTSTLNSSSTPLLANATFTGSYENISTYQEVCVSSFSNVSGTLFLDISQDGITTLNTFSFPASPNTTIISPVDTNFARIRYTNGGTNQSNFNLITLFKPIGGSVTSTQLVSTLTDTLNVQNVRATLVGKNSSAVYTNVGTDLDGGVNAHVTNFPTTLPIYTTKNPAGVSIGTIAYYQTAVFGGSLGLLLALTVSTPRFIKSIQTSNGLFPVNL